MKLGSFTFPDAALNQHVAILGKTGSGKSYAAKGLVERLLDSHHQVCVLDPTAAWWGLRLGADGRSRGYDIVLLGGQHADIPLAERSGAAVARLITEQGASMVIDTSGFTVGEYTRWFIDFAGTLYTTIRNPLHLVIDEAHNFMPQGKSPDVDAGRMLHAGNRLMSGGRSKGLRGLLITQRPAKLHKDSLTCADTLIAMRVIAPQDRAAIKDWIDGAGDQAKGREVLDSLAQLERGEGWAWYPEGGYLERGKFPKIKTYDSSATPEHGAKAGPKVAEIKLDEVKAALSEAVKEAEANDPKLLRAKIAQLEAEARKSGAPAPVVKIDEKATARAVAERDRHWKAEFAKVTKALDLTTGRLGQIAKLAHLNGEMPKIEAPAAVKIAPARVAAAPIQRPARADGPSDESLPKGERSILTACTMYEGGVDRAELTILTGYKRSTRDAYVQRLSEKGYVVAGDKIKATVRGVEALGNFDPLPTGNALLQWWLQRLPEGERKILEALAAAWPQTVDRESLTETTGYKRSTRDAYLQRLGGKRLVESHSGGVRASESLFDAVIA